eukprot:UN15577
MKEGITWTFCKFISNICSLQLHLR